MKNFRLLVDPMDRQKAVQTIKMQILESIALTKADGRFTHEDAIVALLFCIELVTPKTTGLTPYLTPDEELTLNAMLYFMKTGGRLRDLS